VKKVWLGKPGDSVHKLHKSEDIAVTQTEPVASKQTESIQPLVEHQQLSYRDNVERTSGMDVVRLMDIHPVKQQKKVAALMDFEIVPKIWQPVGDTSQIKKVISEPPADRKHIPSNSREASQLKVEDAETVSARKKAAALPAEPVEEQVDAPQEDEVPVPQALLVTSPVAEAVVETTEAVIEETTEEPTTEAELQTNDEPEILSPVIDKVHEADSKPESIQPEQTAPQFITAFEKTEVSTKNIAEVKPLLVASVPEKSKWEREVADILETPLYRTWSRDQDRRVAAAKTTLPRSVCTYATLLLFGLSDIIFVV